MRGTRGALIGSGSCPPPPAQGLGAPEPAGAGEGGGAFLGSSPFLVSQLGAKAAARLNALSARKASTASERIHLICLSSPPRMRAWRLFLLHRSRPWERRAHVRVAPTVASFELRLSYLFARR